MTKDLFLPESVHNENSLEEKREYNKQNRAKHLDEYNKEKAKVDALESLPDIISYIQDCETGSPIDRGDKKPRVGLHSMKVNAYELAIIRCAQEVMGARSSRELFISLCEKAIDDDDSFEPEWHKVWNEHGTNGAKFYDKIIDYVEGDEHPYKSESNKWRFAERVTDEVAEILEQD